MPLRLSFRLTDPLAREGFFFNSTITSSYSLLTILYSLPSMKIVAIAGSRIPSDTANSIQVMKACSALAQLGHDLTLIVPGHPTSMTLGPRDVAQDCHCRDSSPRPRSVITHRSVHHPMLTERGVLVFVSSTTAGATKPAHSSS